MWLLKQVDLIVLAAAAVAASPALGLAQNHAPNPFRAVEGVWAPLPDGRWGSTSAPETRLARWKDPVTMGNW